MKKGPVDFIAQDYKIVLCSNVDDRFESIFRNDSTGRIMRVTLR